MTKRIVVYADKTAALNRIATINSILGYPRKPTQIVGGGIPAPEADTLTTSHCQLLESKDGSQYGFVVDKEAEDSLSAAIKARIQDVEPLAWCKAYVSFESALAVTPSEIRTDPVDSSLK